MALVKPFLSQRGETLKVTRDVATGTLLLQENACLHSCECQPHDRLLDLTFSYISRRCDVLDNRFLRINALSIKETEMIEQKIKAADFQDKSDYVKNVYLKMLHLTKHVEYRAFYRLGSVLNHSCAPTAQITITGQTLYVVALSDISCLSEVTVCYRGIDSSASTDVRRTQIARAYSFDCECAKCCPDVIEKFCMMGMRHHSAPAFFNPFLNEDH